MLRMNKLAKALKAIGLIVRKPWLLNRVLQDPDVWKESVVRKYGLSNGLPLITPDVLFGDEPGGELTVFTFLDGGSLVTDLILLRNLASGFNKCSYFEIGTWRGESVANISSVAETCYTLNLSDEEMHALDIDENTIALQGYFSKHLKNVVHLRQNSLSFDFASLNRKFDLLFIDGEHHYHAVRKDTENVMRHLVHGESVVVWHDYGYTPEHIRFEVLAGILDGTPSELHPYLYHVAGTKSAVLIRKEFPAVTLKEPVKPDFYYNVKIRYIKTA
jgi:hypothetical protein